MPLDNFLSQLTFPIATWVSKHYVYFIDVKTEEQNGHILATQWQSKIWTQPFMGPGRKCPVSFFCCCCYAYPVGQAQKTPNVMVSQIRPRAQNSSYKATTFAKFLWLLSAKKKIHKHDSFNHRSLCKKQTTIYLLPLICRRRLHGVNLVRNLCL